MEGLGVENFWNTLWQFGVFCSYLVCGMVISYILLLLGLFSPILYITPRKIWQPFLLRYPFPNFFFSSATLLTGVSWLGLRGTQGLIIRSVSYIPNPS
jgi:signal transduction histidine kinase